MTSLVACSNYNSPRLCYTNGSPSSVITNTSAETAFDQVFTFPSQSQHSIQPTSVVRMHGYGTISTGLLNLGFTLRIRWGGVSGTLICSSQAITLAASLSSEGWGFDAQMQVVQVGASGLLEGQGYCSFGSSLTGILADHMSNNGQISIDTTVPQDVVLTAQWGTAATANQVQLRTIFVTVDGP